MAQVEIRDASIWIKHIHGDPGLKETLEKLAPGSRIWLRIARKRGCFEKMKRGPNGPMQGLKPVDDARMLWRDLYPSRRGELVEVTLDEDPPASAPADWASASDAQRDAAWAAFKALMQAGWSSDGPATGGRDGLHDRG